MWAIPGYVDYFEEESAITTCSYIYYCSACILVFTVFEGIAFRQQKAANVLKLLEFKLFITNLS